MSNLFVLNANIDTIICDIEGTTTSIAFVKDVLFPYARNTLKEYLFKNIDTQECKEDILLLREQMSEDNQLLGEVNVPQIIQEDSANRQQFIESIVDNVLWQMDSDRKAKALKQLQGHIWKYAFENELVKGHVYDDVLPAFERWLKKDCKLYIYSSGSIQAQKLLFGYSEKGNLLKYLSGHFDTTIGNKTESSSYSNILKSLDKNDSCQVLFLTDLVKEAEAAKQAGLNVCVIRRNDNPDKATNNFEWVENFDAIQ